MMLMMAQLIQMHAFIFFLFAFFVMCHKCQHYDLIEMIDLKPNSVPLNSVAGMVNFATEFK